MFYNKFIELCSIKGEKPSPILKKTNISSGNLKRWKDGAGASPETLNKLARFFDVPVGYFFEEDEPTENKKFKFGERIRAIRKNAGCSQKEFCSVLDIPQSTLSAYETDRMQPTVVTLINIATKFNVSMDWLCGIKELPLPTVKLNGKGFSTEIPASVFIELMSVIIDESKSYR